MQPLITVADLEARFGRTLDTTETAQAEALITDASALVRDIADEDFTDSTGALDVPSAIVPVVVAMVRRGLENPRGLTGENLGDYGWQQQGSANPATLFPTRREKRAIRRAVQKLAVGTVTLQGFYPYASGTDDSLLPHK